MSKKRYKDCFVECVPAPEYPGLYIPKTVVVEKRAGDFMYIETTCLVYVDGALKVKAAKNIIGNTMSIRYGIDKMGRIWELFIDPCYYDCPCVKMVDDRDFNSPNIFTFDSLEEAMSAMAEFMIKSGEWVV